MVARRAHNPKVVGSNPAPATKFLNALLKQGVLFYRLISCNLLCSVILLRNAFSKKYNATNREKTMLRYGLDKFFRFVACKT